MKLLICLIIILAILSTNGYYLYNSYKEKDRRLLAAQATLLSIALLIMMGAIFGIFDLSIISVIKRYLPQ